MAVLAIVVLCCLKDRIRQLLAKLCLIRRTQPLQPIEHGTRDREEEASVSFKNVSARMV